MKVELTLKQTRPKFYMLEVEFVVRMFPWVGAKRRISSQRCGCLVMVFFFIRAPGISNDYSLTVPDATKIWSLALAKRINKSFFFVTCLCVLLFSPTVIQLFFFILMVDLVFCPAQNFAGFLTLNSISQQATCPHDTYVVGLWPLQG